VSVGQLRGRLLLRFAVLGRLSGVQQRTYRTPERRMPARHRRTDPDDDCTAEAPSSCGTNGLCSGAAACALYPSGTACGSTTCSNNQQTGFACDGAGACQSASVSQCAPYFCQGSTCGTTCATDASCAASHHCSGASKCDADLPNGTACTRDSMCVSGFLRGRSLL
jgi:hypothetical protein